ncbi:MAG: hypothetical protein JO305_01015 [Alphaproteobacteria bacterium]|nr:hypothetical protein [Alphaproteobacteria bacterium]
MPSLPSSARKWLGCCSRAGMLLGIGALSALSASAEATPIDGNVQPREEPQQNVAASGEMLIWCEGERIYLSESGGAARELGLGATAEAHDLRQLLERAGATGAAAGVRLDRLILAGGGGEGFHWAQGGRKPAAGTAVPTPVSPPTMAPVAAPSGGSAQTDQAPIPGPSAGSTAGRSNHKD